MPSKEPTLAESLETPRDEALCQGGAGSREAGCFESMHVDITIRITRSLFSPGEFILYLSASLLRSRSELAVVSRAVFGRLD